jgi:uncharacterized protein (TIGR02453 family)
MAFAGWPAEAFTFYEGLSEDNSKAYWTAHRATFETAVQAPLEELVDELEPVLGPAWIMRPYRDIRFSKDKSVYRTWLGARIGDAMVGVSAAGLGVGGGMRHLAPDQLERYREAVADDGSGEELRTAIATVAAAGFDVHGTDPLRTAPRGYPADHARIDLLRNKGLIAWKRWPASERWIGTPAAKARITAAIEESAPLRAWLRERVGPSQLEPRRRGGR